jgi:phage terminase small subunit
MGLQKRLTEKQKRFAELLVYSSKSAKECAKEAGYGSSSHVRACELRNPKIYPLVCNYIEEVRTKRFNEEKIEFTKSLSLMNDLLESSLNAF